jgi:hypothetical protein
MRADFVCQMHAYVACSRMPRNILRRDDTMSTPVFYAQK